MTVPAIVLVIVGLLLVAGLMEPLAARFRLPATVFLALLGITIAAGSAELLRLAPFSAADVIARTMLDLPIGSEGFIYVFLPVLLFKAALDIDVRQMAEDAVTVLTLAVVAVVAATFTIGLALRGFVEIPLIGCLLLGAIVATTDPGAVIGIFRDAGAPQRLSRLVEGESLLNDAAAVVLFELFIAQLVSHEPSAPLTMVAEFVFVPAGGALVGYVGATLCAMLFRHVRDNRLVLVSVTLALPFAAMIIAAWLGLSGFVAVVSAGITLSAMGPPRSKPESWRYVHDIWEQLAFWASSLLFVLAAILIPTMLRDFGVADLVTVLIVVVAALVSRAVVLFGVLPMLTALRLSPRVSLSYKAMIVWGGLRGAATLALALAVTEHEGIGPDVQRFVAVGATGFVLFTLFVQGLSLRPLMRWLQLDRLTPMESALHEHAVALVAAEVRGKMAKAAASFGISLDTVAKVAGGHLQRFKTAPVADWQIATDDRVGLSLAAMTSRESAIVLGKMSELLVPPGNASALLRQTRSLLDAIRSQRHTGYLAAAKAGLAFSWQFRLAHALHRRFGLSVPLSSQLSDRFEMLVASRSVIEELRGFPPTSIGPLFGDDVAEVIEAARSDRLAMVVRELDALRLQYPAYAEELYRTLLIRSALQIEETECLRLYEEGLISQEVHRALFERIDLARKAARQRPMLDLQLNTRQLAENFPLFAGFSKANLDAVVRLLRPVTAIPGELIIRKGARGDACFFVASGAVEVDTGSAVLRLGRGDVFGEIALITGLPRQADVVSIAYCSLLRLSSRDFAAFLDTQPELRKQVEGIAATRTRENDAQSRGGPTAASEVAAEA